ncbi:MAG: hypothetical protein LBU30_06110 [Candidatus Methanoplasma sp.]|jgi:hypothetical protein|nr:hypothetical protein [Candidatus Methanoplasma sp.]
MAHLKQLLIILPVNGVLVFEPESYADPAGPWPCGAYEMRLPRGYVELSEEEMEYDGGFFWIVPCAIISAVCTAVSAGRTVLSCAGIGGDTVNKIGQAATIVGTVTGIASGVGGLWTATAATSAAKLAGYTSNLTPEPGMGVATYYL